MGVTGAGRDGLAKEGVNKKEGNGNLIFLVDLVMTLASANGRDAQSPPAMMRM